MTERNIYYKEYRMIDLCNSDDMTFVSAASFVASCNSGNNFHPDPFAFSITFVTKIAVFYLSC